MVNQLNEFSISQVNHHFHNKLKQIIILRLIGLSKTFLHMNPKENLE